MCVGVDKSGQHRFTAEVRNVWTETYQLVAGVMMRAAYEAEAA